MSETRTGGVFKGNLRIIGDRIREGSFTITEQERISEGLQNLGKMTMENVQLIKLEGIYDANRCQHREMPEQKARL